MAASKEEREAETRAYAHVSEMTVIDVGCGVGNTALLNLLEMQQLRQEEEQFQLQNQQEECDDLSPPAPSKPPALNVHFLDASNEALQKLQCDFRYKLAVATNADKANELKSTAATVTSQVYDLASPQTETTDHLHQSADIALLLFTLSAIGPYQLQSNQTHFSGVVNAVQNAARMLKPGGMILFRDYAHYDDDQLRELFSLCFLWLILPRLYTHCSCQDLAFHY